MEGWYSLENRPPALHCRSWDVAALCVKMGKAPAHSEGPCRRHRRVAASWAAQVPLRIRKDGEDRECEGDPDEERRGHGEASRFPGDGRESEVRQGRWRASVTPTTGAGP